MQEDPVGERRKIPQTVYFLIPLLILAIVLAGWVWYRDRMPDSPTSQATRSATAPAPTSQSAEIVDIPGDGFGIVSGLATPWAVPGGPGELTATVPVEEPASAPQATIALSLLGPPAGSFFRLDDVVTFYWSSPELPDREHQFIVYLLDGAERLVMGSVSEENLGRGYQLQGVPGRLAGKTGDFRWLVALENKATGAIIGQSESRPLTVIDGN